MYPRYHDMYPGYHDIYPGYYDMYPGYLSNLLVSNLIKYIIVTWIIKIKTLPYHSKFRAAGIYWRLIEYISHVLYQHYTKTIYHIYHIKYIYAYDIPYIKYICITDRLNSDFVFILYIKGTY